MDFWSWIFAAIFCLAPAVAIAAGRLLLVVPAPGALAAFALSLVRGIPVYVEPIVFAAVTLLSYFVISRLPRRRLTPLETMVGKSCTVTERIDPLNGGQVTVDGGLWAARALAPDASYEEGAVLSVVAIEGVKLILG